jgi:hypothetical protein
MLLKIRPQSGLLVLLGLAYIVVLGCYGDDGADGSTGPRGRDGDNGTSYIAYTWVNILTLSSDDPGLPYTVVNSQPYRTYPGTYHLSYTSWNYSTYNYSYSIYINEGESGRPGQPGEPGEPGELFWQDGADGADGARGADGDDGDNIWFEITLFSTGPTIYAWPSASYLGKSINGEGESQKFQEAYGIDASGRASLIPQPLDYDLFLDQMSKGEPTVQEILIGKYRFRLEYLKVR